MYVFRNMTLVIVAVIFDGAQAFISAGIAVIAAFPLATGGCVAGGQLAGSLGCWLGGGVLGILSITPVGAVANAALATLTIPLGFMLGIAINMCLTLIAAAVLFLLMKMFDVEVTVGQLSWNILEGVPGVNNLPFWTFFTVSTLWKNATAENSEGALWTAAAFVAAPTRGVMSLKEQTMRVPGVQEAFNQRGLTQYESERPTWDTNPQRGDGSRIPLHDIRPAKSNA